MKKQNDISAPVYSALTIHIAAPPEKVWSVLTSLAQWPAWNPRILFARLLGSAVEPGAEFTWKVNGVRIRSEFLIVDRQHRLSWKGKTFGATAEHSWSFESVNGETRLTVQESMDGWLVRLFKGKMNRDLKADMQFWTEALKHQCESR